MKSGMFVGVVAFVLVMALAESLPATVMIGLLAGLGTVLWLKQQAPTADLARALAEAEALRLRVRGQPLWLGEVPLQLSVSIGVAEWAGVTEDPSRLLARADAALYRAKRLGRDRVEAAAGDADAPGRPQTQAG